MATTPPEEERRIHCLACWRLFPMSRLRDHEGECSQMPRLDDELDLPGKSLIQ